MNIMTCVIRLCLCARWKGKEATGLLNFPGIAVFKWSEVFFGMRDRLQELRLILCPYELNILLEPQHELKIALGVDQ
jgi:hypothetical protein